MKLEELLQEGASEPTGVIASAADGRMFFIPDDHSTRFGVRQIDLYSAFQIVSRTSENSASSRRCAEVKHWLDTHDPRTELWQRICVRYLDEC